MMYITVPEDHIVGSTGELQNPEDVLNAVTGTTQIELPKAGLYRKTGRSRKTESTRQHFKTALYHEMYEILLGLFNAFVGCMG